MTPPVAEITSDHSPTRLTSCRPVGSAIPSLLRAHHTFFVGYGCFLAMHPKRRSFSSKLKLSKRSQTKPRATEPWRTALPSRHFHPASVLVSLRSAGLWGCSRPAATSSASLHAAGRIAISQPSLRVAQWVTFCSTRPTNCAPSVRASSHVPRASSGHEQRVLCGLCDARLLAAGARFSSRVIASVPNRLARSAGRVNGGEAAAVRALRGEARLRRRISG